MEIVKVDYNNKQQGDDLVFMLNQYAVDEQGGGQPLSDYTQENLIDALRQTPIAVSFLVYKGSQPIGLANCLYGFSTFKAKSLLNVHDLAVHSDYRGQGIGTMLLERVEEEAILNGCCKITLEVLEQNERAKHVYQKFGFEGYNLGDNSNNALFWEKELKRG